MTAAEVAHRSDRPRGTWFRPIVVVVLAGAVSFLALTGVAVWAYRTQVERATTEAGVHLTRVAQGNSSILGYWLAEGKSDIRVLAATSRVRNEYEAYRAGDEAAGDWLRLRLEAERSARGYVNISVFDVDGTQRLSFGQDSPQHLDDLKRYAAQAGGMTTGTVTATHPGDNGSYHIAWFAPLRIQNEPGGDRTTGVVMYEADIASYLREVVAEVDDPWPTTVAVRVNELADTYVASTVDDFQFTRVSGGTFPGDDVVSGIVAVPDSKVSVIAFAPRQVIVDSLAWERATIAGADMFVFFVFALFMLAYARSERNRRREMLAKEQLEDALDTQDRFLANMSHDLRTPLNSIIGFSTLLKNGLAGPLNEEQLRQVTMIEASGQHLLALVTDVLELSKMKAGMEDVDPESVRVADLVAFITDVLAPQVDDKCLSWEVDVPDDLEIVTDRRLAERVLLNLAGNAVKFTVNGGVTITARPMAGEVAIKVHDTGPGVEYGAHREIMREFKQLYRRGDKKPEGSGLGLAICDKTARLLGGRIEVDSVPGEGATFTFVLPVAGALS